MAGARGALETLPVCRLGRAMVQQRGRSIEGLITQMAVDSTNKEESDEIDAMSSLKESRS